MRSAWTARARGATMFLSNGCGGRSQTRKSPCAPTVASRRRVAGWTAMWHSTTGADRIPHLAGKRPIRPISTSQRQARRRHNQRGDPLIDSSQTVQNRRATSVGLGIADFVHDDQPFNARHSVARLKDIACAVNGLAAHLSRITTMLPTDVTRNERMADSSFWFRIVGVIFLVVGFVLDLVSIWP